MARIFFIFFSEGFLFFSEPPAPRPSLGTPSGRGGRGAIFSWRGRGGGNRGGGRGATKAADNLTKHYAYLCCTTNHNVKYLPRERVAHTQQISACAHGALCS